MFEEREIENDIFLYEKCRRRPLEGVPIAIGSRQVSSSVMSHKRDGSGVAARTARLWEESINKHECALSKKELVRMVRMP